jgi:hypothetical protein
MVAKVYPKKPTLRGVTMTPHEVDRAIYIDFEGTEIEPATFLGVLCEGQWQVYLIETAFHKAEVTHKLGTLHKSSLPSVCRRIASQSRKEDRKVVAWSSREIDEITQCPRLTMAERAWWESNLINLLPPAKRWANRQGVTVPPIPGHRGNQSNKWSLSGFRKATGYPIIATAFEPGKTASRIRHVRGQLKTRGRYDRLTPVAKGKWSKVLTHNYHDCAGLKHVAETIYGSRRGRK